MGAFRAYLSPLCSDLKEEDLIPFVGEYVVLTMVDGESLSGKVTGTTHDLIDMVLPVKNPAVFLKADNGEGWCFSINKIKEIHVKDFHILE